MDKITLAHGSGGRLMHELIDSVFLKEFSNKLLDQKKDSAVFKLRKETIAFTTDSYVVDPIFFPGGDIGGLAVNGTVNDLSVSGARPLYISCSMIIEEGLGMPAIRRVADSIRRAAKASGVRVVTGDTKVVGKGKCDKLFINTSGIGVIEGGAPLSQENIKPGDALIVNGPVGDHAVSVLSVREGISFGSTVKSDTAPLNGLIGRALKASRKIKFMRDPTRGGLAATLNEITEGRNFSIAIDEESLPVSRGTKSACELLGLDPLYLANEGKVIMVTAPEDAEKVLGALRKHRLGAKAEIIGRVERGNKGKVYLKTVVGGKRIIDMPAGDQLPRIC